MIGCGAYMFDIFAVVHLFLPFSKLEIFAQMGLKQTKGKLNTPY